MHVSTLLVARNMSTSRRCSFLVCALLVVLSTCSWQGVTSQPDCSIFPGLQGNNAQDGRNLAVCATSSSQCCSSEDISQWIMAAQVDLESGLQKQFTQKAQLFDTMISNIIEFMDNFTAELLASATLVTLHPNQTQLIADYVMQLNRDIIIRPNSTFNVQTYIQSYFIDVQTAARRAASSDPADWECIGQVLTPRVNRTRLSLIIQQYSTIRLCVSTLDRIRQFLTEFAQRTFEVPNRCAQSFIGLYCIRCRESSVQPLCRNVCGALVKACYSPFYTGLEEQFELLWTVSRRVLAIANSTVIALTANSGGFGIGEIDVLLNEVEAMCPNVDFPPVPRADPHPQNLKYLPSQIGRGLNLLMGAIQYEASGPSICSPRNQLRSGIETTSTGICWDGSQRVASDIPAFEGNGITEQVDNPVIILESTVLAMQAGGLGAPVDMLFNSQNFSSVLPPGLELTSVAFQAIPTASILLLPAVVAAILAYNQ